MKTPSRQQIVETTKKHGGLYTVNRNSYRADTLRNKLKKMAKDLKCPLRYHSHNQTQITYEVTDEQ